MRITCPIFIPKPNVGWRYIISYGLVFGIGLWGLVNLGIKTGLSAGIASLLLQFSAFFTILSGSKIFREKLTHYQLAGIAISSAGLLSIVFITDGSVTFSGMVLVLAGAAAWSIANIINKKAGTRQVFAFLVWSSAFAPVPLFLLDYMINGAGGYTLLLTHNESLSSVKILAVLLIVAGLAVGLYGQRIRGALYRGQE